MTKTVVVCFAQSYCRESSRWYRVVRQDFSKKPMTAKNYARLAAVIFAIVAVLQLGRALSGLPVAVGATSIPLWASWVVCIVTAGLAWLGFGASRG
jgi:hypothetical protein